MPRVMTRAPVLPALFTKSEEVRQRFTVTGVVQGVGFRPFVHRTASELGLAGFVGNDSGAVFLEVQGDGALVAEFGRRLRAHAPALAWLPFTFLAIPWLAVNALICLFVARAMLRKEA